MRETIKQRLDIAVFQIYTALSLNQYPIEPKNIVRHVANCRYMSYEKLAEISGYGVEDVIRSCRSADGCTQFDRRNNRYLVLINEAGRSDERIRWTCAHELGHIAAGHFLEPDFIEQENRRDEREEEADYFAASFLCPFPAISRLFIQNATELADCFGLSQTAAGLRWNEYMRLSDAEPMMDSYFVKHTARTTGRKYRYHTERAIDVWADDSAML